LKTRGLVGIHFERSDQRMEGAENKEVTGRKAAWQELKIGEREGQLVLTKYFIMEQIHRRGDPDQR